MKSHYAAKLKEFETIVSDTDFNENNFKELEKIFQELYHDLKEEKIPEVRNQIHKIIGSENIEQSIQGFAFRKPHGYAGDFEIIDKMYREETHENPKIGIWDKYYHFNAAALAVRNRKEFFKKLIDRKISSDGLAVLNLASGPCRDLFEYFESNEESKVNFDCVEMDKKAVTFAKSLNEKYLSKINFINKNIFKFEPTKQYDLIWSAGLFDYFTDEVFVQLIKKMKSWITEGGEIVIGNFTDANPTQGYMELMVDWKLNLRGEKKLGELALEAGFTAEKIRIEQEAAKVNLFLVLVS